MIVTIASRAGCHSTSCTWTRSRTSTAPGWRPGDRFARVDQLARVGVPGGLLRGVPAGLGQTRQVLRRCRGTSMIRHAAATAPDSYFHNFGDAVTMRRDAEGFVVRGNRFSNMHDDAWLENDWEHNGVYEDNYADGLVGFSARPTRAAPRPRPASRAPW